MIDRNCVDSIEDLVSKAELPRDHELLVSKLKNPHWKWLLLQLLFEQSIKEEKTIKAGAFSALDGYNTYDSCAEFLSLVSDDFRNDPSLIRHSRWPTITRMATRHLVSLRKNTDHPEFKKIMPCNVTLPSADVVDDVFQMLSNSEHSKYGIEREIAEAFCPRGNWASHRPYIGEEGDFFYFCVAILSQQNGFVIEDKKVDYEEFMRFSEEARKMEREAIFIDFDEQKEPDASIALISRLSQSRVMPDRLSLFLRLREENPSWLARADGKLVYFWNPETESLLFHTDVPFDRAISICRKNKCRQLVFTDGTHRQNTFSMDKTLEIMALAKGLAEYEFDDDLNYATYLGRIESFSRSYYWKKFRD